MERPVTGRSVLWLASHFCALRKTSGVWGLAPMGVLEGGCGALHRVGQMLVLLVLAFPTGAVAKSICPSFFPAEMDVVNAIFVGGEKSDVKAPERAPDVVEGVFVTQRATHAHPPGDRSLLIVHGRQCGWHGSSAGPVVLGRHFIVEGFVRASMVVDRTPVVEGALTLIVAFPCGAGEDFGFEGTVEALQFSLCLRVIRPPVEDVDPQPPEPDSKLGDRTAVTGIAPGRTIVAEDAFREAVGAEEGFELRSDGDRVLMGTAENAQGEAGVIVKAGEGMAGALVGGEVALEIHLPEIVRRGPLEAQQIALGALVVDQSMAPEDAVDRAACGHRFEGIGLENPVKLPGPPGRVLGAQRHHGPLDPVGDAPGGCGRPAGLILRSAGAEFPMALEPLVTGRGTEGEMTAQGPHIGSLQRGRIDELLA